MRNHQYSLLDLALLVVISSCLGVTAFNALGPLRVQAREVKCRENLRHIARAIRLYCQDYDGEIPRVGQEMNYWEVGLPAPTQLGYFFSKYVPDAHIRFCPAYEDFERVHPRTSYVWQMGAEFNVRNVTAFRQSTARLGERRPIVICEQHNRRAPSTEAWRRGKNTLLVLRLNGEITRDYIGTGQRSRR